jgi:peptide/nickel transport system substrate-binding protein
MERYEDHYKESPKLERGGNIKRIHARLIPDISTQVAELLGGGIDWMWYVPADQAEQMEGMPNLTVVNEQVFRAGALVIDATGRSGVEALKDKRVRKAIAHAIDRKAMVDNLAKGKSQIFDTPCYPTQFGCNKDAAVVYDFDVEKARALMKEAGYENGFSVDMYAWRSRQWSEAIVSYLADIGIKVNLHQLDYFAIRDMMRSGKTPITFIDDGYYRLNDSATIWQRFFSGAPDDQAHDDEVKAWVDEAAMLTDPEKRKEIYDKVIAKVTDEAYWAPLFTFSANYAFSNDVEFTPNIDEMPRWYNARWK